MTAGTVLFLPHEPANVHPPCVQPVLAETCSETSCVTCFPIYPNVCPMTVKKALYLLAFMSHPTTILIIADDYESPCQVNSLLIEY